MELKSSAKINIGLHVHSKRSDGFHNISTLFQEINLYDSLQEQNKNKPKFTFHDGPPYANGPIHLQSGDRFTLDAAQDDDSGDQHSVGIDYKDFVFSYNYSYQFGDVNFGSGGFHQITIGFNFLRGSIECDCF